MFERFVAGSNRFGANKSIAYEIESSLRKGSGYATDTAEKLIERYGGRGWIEARKFAPQLRFLI